MSVFFFLLCACVRVCVCILLAMSFFVNVPHLFVVFSFSSRSALAGPAFPYVASVCLRSAFMDLVYACSLSCIFVFGPCFALLSLLQCQDCLRSTLCQRSGAKLHAAEGGGRQRPASALAALLTCFHFRHRRDHT